MSDVVQMPECSVDPSEVWYFFQSINWRSMEPKKLHPFHTPLEADRRFRGNRFVCPEVSKSHVGDNFAKADRKVLQEKQRCWPRQDDHGGRVSQPSSHISGRVSHPASFQSTDRGPVSNSPQLRRSKRLAGKEPSPTPDIFGRTSNEQKLAGQSNKTKSIGKVSHQEFSSSIEPYGRMHVAFSTQPPRKVRTDSLLPRVAVRVTIDGSEFLAREGPSLGVGTLHAVVSLWYADGQVATPHSVPPFLTGHKDATLVNAGPISRKQRTAEATFADLSIRHSGHFRLRVSIMETAVPDDDEQGIHSPRQLLSVDTRPVYVNNFVDLA